MLVVVHFAEEIADFDVLAEQAIAVLAARPGFVRARLARSTDVGGGWVLTCEWESVGAWRRALSAYEVKVGAAPLLALGIDAPSAFEVLVEHEGGTVRRHRSDRAPGAS